jgi:thymidylate kinase
LTVGSDLSIRSEDLPFGGGLEVLPLVAELCRTLREEGIVWNHWKSNEAIERSASGENDLDLLVRRADGERFAEVLRRLGFREGRLPPVKELPGVFHAYGLDHETGSWVHVHAHLQLILGDDMTKNYRLPIEEAYLDSSVTGELFELPTPAFELAVFAIRMVLKHATLDAMLMGHGALAASERRELVDLSEQASDVDVRTVYREHLPFIPIELVDAMLEVIRGGGSRWRRVLVARRLRRCLVPVARRPRPVDTWLRIWRRVRFGFRRFVLRRRTRKSLESGGALIAVVGGDGAGKSTAVGQLSEWLGAAFVTERVHLGKPPWSFTTFLVKGPIAAARRYLGWFQSTRRPAHEFTGEGREFPGYAWLIWHVLSARDRARAYVKARRRATNGTLVVCDRYPVRSIRFMEGARAAWLEDRPDLGRLVGWLVRRERRYRSMISDPDILLVLRLAPEVAVARKPDEDPAFVRARNAEVWEARWAGTDAVVIDAGGPRQDVERALKGAVWDRL